MKEYLSNAELETKASRETIMRLVSESEKEQQSNNRYALEMDTIRTVSIQLTTLTFIKFPLWSKSVTKNILLKEGLTIPAIQ